MKSGVDPLIALRAWAHIFLYPGLIGMFDKEDTVELIDTDADNSDSLDDRAVAANQSEEIAKVLIEEFLPFLRARVARYSMRFDEHIRDDILSSAMLALYEAIQKYDIDKGHFFPFADRVVCARIIDQIRIINRQEGNTVPLHDVSDNEQSAQSSAINVISIRNYDEERRRSRLAEEIEQFTSEIATWGITMANLVKNSPKHKELRKTYKKVVADIIRSPDIIQTINVKRYFPVKSIAKLTGLPQKKLERARTYIVAAIVIKTGDYELLSTYIEEGGRG